MKAKLRMLLWKECCERRTQFLICLVWMLGGATYCVAYEMTHRFRDPVASFHTIASVYGMFLPIFLAMRTSLGEITDRTRSVSDALPVSVRTRGWIRWGGGASVLIVPILVGAATLAVCLATGLVEQVAARQAAGSGQLKFMERPPLEFVAAMKMLATIVLVSSAAGLMTYGVLTLIGTWLTTESHLGFVGVVVVALSFLGHAVGTMQHNGSVSATVGTVFALLFPEGTIISWGYGERTGGYSDLEFVGWPNVVAIASLALQLGLAIVFVLRYARKSGRSSNRVDAKLRRVLIRMPALRLHRPTFALLWLTLRVSVPVCISGLTLALLFTILQMQDADSYQYWHVGGHVNHDLGDVSFVGRYTDAMSSAMWIVGLLWAVVVGSSLFSAEVDRRLGEFWRSLPVSVGRFYAIKFVLGMLATLLLLDGLIIALTWNAPIWGHRYSMNWSYIACVPLLHAVMFSVAVAWTCFLRRPVIGGMAALGSFMLLNIGLEWFDVTRDYDPISVYNNLLNFAEPGKTSINLASAGYPVVATLMMLTVVVAAIAGHVAIRRYEVRRSAWRAP